MKKLILAVLAAVVILAIVALAYFYFQFKPADQIRWGVTFSRPQAEYLGYDWKTMYLDILNDLQPQNLRIVTYWETMEAQPDLWFFQDIDEMLAEADKRGLNVTLVVGEKVPRWPECHDPAWYAPLASDEKIDARVAMIKMAVNHFKSHSSIKRWQLEDEPFNSSGTCAAISSDLLKLEYDTLRGVDPRPVVITVNGEAASWVSTAKLYPDVLGVSMYRVMHGNRLGYFENPLPPVGIRIKSGIVKTFAGTDNLIGTELQAEPWFVSDVFHTDLNEQYALMNPKIFADNVSYARKVGFSENYLWGVEWWYWMAHEHNDWGMWSAAKSVLK